jgi:FAD:protein FMN transferase
MVVNDLTRLASDPHPARVTRRRFIRISAAAAGTALLPAERGADAATAVEDAARHLRTWKGVALGADAMLQIHHPDPAAADRLIEQSLAEVARLEKIFSLYRDDSALRRLNRDGRIDEPPLELLELLGQGEGFSKLTAGAFDVTVQPLWDLYAGHFSRSNAEPSGPSKPAIGAVLKRVGHDGIELDSKRISFGGPGMAVTLNGIAQGYITDRVVGILRDAGLDRSLVDMGETRAIGTRPSGDPWIVGLEDPLNPGRVAERIEIVNQAVATSGGYGTQFDSEGRFNHIFDPTTGETSWRYLSVSVVAPTATAADALSTAFSLMSLDAARRVTTALDVKAHFVMPDGSRVAV